MGIVPDGVFGPTTMKTAMQYYNLSAVSAAHFFGQTGHESAGFTRYEENLNYSAEGLRKIFNRYFPGNMSELYARQPIKIASRVYGNRMGNGDEASRDGWYYRGRGAIQLTGKNNYMAFSKYMNNSDIMRNPDIVATEYAFESAIYYFDVNKLWAICNKGLNDNTIVELTKRINGGTHGIDDRIDRTIRYYNYIN